MILTIDPGLKGAFCFYYDKENINFYPMVDIYDIQSLKEILTKEDIPEMVYIEKAQSMPSQGVRSMFSYGKHTGWVIGVLQGRGLKITEVPPQTWCKVAHAGITSYSGAGSGKLKSLEAVNKLFPELSLIHGKGKKPHEGFVDALLMAYYALHITNKF